MTEDEVFLVGTNILVYAHDKTDMEKHKISFEIVNNCIEKKEKLAVSTQNISEFFSVVIGKKLLAKKEAIEIISDITELENWIKLDFDHKTALEAAKISENHDMHYWDALLAATMKQNGILNLYTENAKDFKVPWLNVVNPFEKKQKPSSS